MRRALPTLVFVAILLAPIATVLAADKVVLKSGNVLTGKILRVTEKKVTIDIEGLGVVDVEQDQIARIDRGDKPPPRTVPTPPPEKPPVEPPDPATPPPAEPGNGSEKPEPPVEEPDPVELPKSSISIPFENLKPGQRALFLLKRKKDAPAGTTGRRMVAQVAVAGEKRAKVIFDSDAGVLGYAWIRREEVERVIEVRDHPDRLILFFDGLEIGCWVEGRAASHGAFGGQLKDVTDTSMVVLVPEGAIAVEVEFPFVDVKVLSGTIREADVEKALAGLEIGEPVALTIRGRSEDLCGRVAEVDATHMAIEVSSPGEKVKSERLFLGMPFLRVRTLPSSLRASFVGVARGDALSVKTSSTTDDAVIRRTFTGTLATVTLESVGLVTREGLVTLLFAKVLSVSQPDPARVEVLLQGKEESDAESVLPVLPGMTRADVEKRLPGGHDGLDILYEEDLVARVYCRAPFEGPVFGIFLGTELAKALERTDLVFETQVDPKGAGLSTLLSTTLANRAVKLFLGPAGEIMAVEVSTR